MLQSRRPIGLRSVLAAGAALAITGAAGAQVTTYRVFLNGPSEVPPNPSPGIGVGQVDVDAVAHTMRVQVTFSGLLGTVTACHIHAPTVNPFVLTAGVATPVPTFPGFPSGVTSGAYDMTFDTTMASSFNPAFVTANGGTPASAEAALFQAMADGKSYLNIHSSMFGGGEIRGFLLPCYPDCNLDGALTVADFGCFQTRFVAAEGYADCNGDGSLTVADFGCFQTQFVADCP